MKKLMLVAICVMAVMMGCKQKGQTASADGKDSVTAVIDSIIEENDTTPMPMFLMGEDSQYALMLYWTNLEEPQKTEDNEDYFEAYHQRWALQDMFRRNKSEYTNMLMGDKFVKVKFVDEVLKDPDGNTPSIGQIHGTRTGIPSLCSRFDFANPKDKKKSEYGYEWGHVVVTDAYLQTRKHLPIKYYEYEWGKENPLPAAVIKQLEQRYGMKASRSVLLCSIGDSCQYGSMQFKGEYKNGPKDYYGDDRKPALALDVLIQGDKVYANEQVGYMFSETEYSWNVDDESRYVGCDLTAAFEGPKGLELCFHRGAPESTTVGMFYLRDGKLIEHEYEGYYNCIDEEIPVWKKDIEEMKKLFLAAEGVDKTVTFTKWAHCYIDYSNEWIWLRDKDEKNGAFFIRKDGKFKLIAVETPKLRPSQGEKDGKQYLSISGSAGGPSIYSEIFAFKNGQQVEHFTALFVYGEIDECGLNGKDLTKEEGKAYCEKLPEGKEITAYFKDIEPEN